MPPSAVVNLSGTQSGEPLTYAKKPGASQSLASIVLGLPTRANAARLAFEAGEAIGARLDAAGIPREPGFRLEVDGADPAHVSVRSDRADSRAIEDLINADPELQKAVQGAAAIAARVSLIDRALQYQKEYRAARTPAEIDEVNARYADLLGGRLPPAAVALDLDRNGLRAMIDGETVRG